MERDLQASLRVLAPEAVTVTAAGTPGDFTSTVEIDTLGFRSIIFGLAPGEDVATDDITFEVWECDTSGGTFTDVASDKYLPTSDTTRALANAGAAGNIQTFGVFGTKRYIKFNLASTTVADDITFTVVTALLAKLRAADVTGIDGNP